MSGRARLRFGERASLSVLAGCVLSLSALPETRANSGAGAALSPWPLGETPSELALTGGLVRLRAKGSPMIRVPASELLMGSTPPEIVDAAALCQDEPLGASCDERSFSDELVQHRVHLSGFFLDRNEVSVAEYEACVRVHRCKAPPYAAGAQRFHEKSLPVTFVSWDDAQAYCAFRGGRLPTEAEFERAARGETARRFPWGELPNGHLANHGRLGMDVTDDSDGFAELAPVGSFSSGRTPEGFSDLAGNVAEWVSDRYATEYSEAEVTDPLGPDAAAATSARVVRGGSYESALPALRGAARSAALPNDRRPSLGFRCARSQHPASP